MLKLPSTGIVLYFFQTTFDIVQTKEVKMTAEDASRILRNENFAEAVAQGMLIFT